MKPKKQHTKSRSRKRRSVIKLKSPRVSVCSKCKHPVMYKDKEELKIKLNKKEKKKRQEEEKESKKKK